MKYVTKGLFALALLIILAAPAQAYALSAEAQTDVTIQVSPAPEGRFLQRLPLLQNKAEEMKKKRDERIEMRQEFRAETKEQRQEETQERRENRWKGFASRHFERLKRRHSEYVTRFQVLISRLQKNIDEKKTAGKDVTAPQAKLNEAKQQLSDAQTQSSKTLSELEKLSTTASVDAQLNVQALQSAQASGKAFLKVQMTLREVVKLLKEIK